MKVIQHLLILILLSTSSLSFTPPSHEICKRNPHHITSARMSGDGGFEVFLHGEADEFKAGDIYNVGIRARRDGQTFNGFMITAVSANMQPLGSFMNLNVSVTKKIRWCPDILSHVDFSSKREVMLEWQAPIGKHECVEFRATVIQKSNSWFKDEGKLTKIFCPEEIVDPPKEDEGECCACGTAKYEMLFEGVWSDQSHPINYPTQKRLLHWSNIVGASHNDNYGIWKYGGTATRGVKEICELGYPRTLEGEIKKRSRDVRTLIKTTGIWWKDPHGIVQNRTARFSTDTKRHLLSVISMLGPSPDWCVGISAVNVCQKDCTWSDGFVVDLTPWDAGTDDGISYMSPNAKSDPQRRIRKITNRWPTDPLSPFFGPNPITPVARLHVRKIGETRPTESQQCDESSLTDFIGDGSSKNQHQTISDNCMVTEWYDWSKCSVTCGVGTRSRRRMYKKAGSDDECDVTLMESENCIGLENECESIEEDCAMTQWSDWSPCSVTCGQGHREKIRYYFEADDEKRCNRSQGFKEVCYGAVKDCMMVKKSPVVCLLPSYKGPCRANFTKWYFDQGMKKCLQFDYGGCRGNENRFESMDECMDVCVSGDTQDKSFCMLSSERGSCGKALEKWYFDKAMQKCLPFEYSGCEGNKNRFDSMDECSDSCQLAGLEGGEGDDMVMTCQQPSLQGTCAQDLERWYFDTQMQKCLPFQYGGCGSNGNNFVTMDECTERCTLNPQLLDAILKKEISSDFLQLTKQGGERGHSRYKRFCTLPQQKGPCRDDLERWYFDLSMLKCVSFVYGGCIGNANNFETIELCQQNCLGKMMTKSSMWEKASDSGLNDEMYMKKMKKMKEMKNKTIEENESGRGKKQTKRMGVNIMKEEMMKQKMRKNGMMKDKMMKKKMIEKEKKEKEMTKKEMMMKKMMMKKMMKKEMTKKEMIKKEMLKKEIMKKGMNENETMNKGMKDVKMMMEDKMMKKHLLLKDWEKKKGMRKEMMKNKMVEKEMMKNKMVERGRRRDNKTMNNEVIKEGNMDKTGSTMKKRGMKVVCVVSTWTSWSSCSAHCGRGHQSRTRKILEKKVAKVGMKCPRRFQRKRSCRSLCSKKCTYKRWSKWSACSKSCGTSIKQRSAMSMDSRLLSRRHKYHMTNPALLPHPDIFSKKDCPDKTQRALCRLPKCPM